MIDNWLTSNVFCGHMFSFLFGKYWGVLFCWIKLYLLNWVLLPILAFDYTSLFLLSNSCSSISNMLMECLYECFFFILSAQWFRGLLVYLFLINSNIIKRRGTSKIANKDKTPYLLGADVSAFQILKYLILTTYGRFYYYHQCLQRT